MKFTILTIAMEKGFPRTKGNFQNWPFDPKIKSPHTQKSTSILLNPITRKTHVKLLVMLCSIVTSWPPFIKLESKQEPVDFWNATPKVEIQYISINLGWCFKAHVVSNEQFKLHLHLNVFLRQCWIWWLRKFLFRVQKESIKFLTCSITLCIAIYHLSSSLYSIIPKSFCIKTACLSFFILRLTCLISFALQDHYLTKVKQKKKKRKLLLLPKSSQSRKRKSIKKNLSLTKCPPKDRQWMRHLQKQQRVDRRSLKSLLVYVSSHFLSYCFCPLFIK